MAFRLILPDDADEPSNLASWLELTEQEDTLQEVFMLWDEDGGPRVAVDLESPAGVFLAPVIAIRGG